MRWRQETRRWVTGLLAVMVAGLTACSDNAPDSSDSPSPPFAGEDQSVAVMTVEGDPVTAETYIPFLYTAFYEQYFQGGMYMFANTGGDVWAQEWEIEGKTYDFAAYLHYQAQKEIICQRAVEMLMKQYGIALSEEKEKELQSEIDKLDKEQLVNYGFTMSAYSNMMRYNYDSEALFYTLYDKGGQYEVPEEDIRAFFDENFLTYKEIELDMSDADGNALEGLAREAVLKKLERFREIYEQEGDFDKLIAYSEAENPGEYADFSYESADAEDNRVDIVYTLHEDEEKAAIVKSMKNGELRLAEYEGKAALLLRLDPEADREEGYYEGCRDNILYQLKFEEHNHEIVDVMNGLNVEIHEKALAKFDPHEFLD